MIALLHVATNRQGSRGGGWRFLFGANLLWALPDPVFAAVAHEAGVLDAPAVAVVAVAALAGLIAYILVQRLHLRSARAALQAQQVELAHLNRLASVGEISASIAHEISQPLGAILSNAEAAEMLLARPGLQLNDLRQILADIRADDLRAYEVIRRLRGLLERHEVEHRDLDLHVTLDKAIKTISAEAMRRQVDIVFQPEAMKSMVSGDAVQLQQVVLNLLINAMDAMQETPRVQRGLHVATRDVKDCVEVQVSDRGHGIASRDAEALFHSFFTTKQGGMGLGLSVARTIVQAHEGTIRAAPRKGGGAVFTVRLPRRPQACPAPTAAISRRSSNDRSRLAVPA
ncbi:ATP-binding protein [uncultured Ramlibacter sp.]|uniref:sensor histidine kinase n=1 Tax=uncultured Ramlibacter sp. TaxID=260755 RepID=UPI002609B360|nr:ATP-binding protein [uncultured Ramlibacter sp.]